MTVNHQLAEQLKKLSDRGMRLTEQRKAMICLLLNSARPLSAVDIYQEMEKEFNGLSYGTVYQNIKLFKELLIIESFVLADEVRFRVINREKPMYYLICMDCERTIPVDVQPEELGLPMPTKSFQPVSYKLDVYGYCVDCNTLNH
ncbi:Fur family transcriptional regulator [Paenibacillus sp. N3.4]|uniref:Fur family transcriptional regulator n=1 Tax=Paenibacillus sp. N3.4 TaxID=2603222 RepID=UPI0011CAEA62|nr:Fur family transcriptional regulator [Paenibacillus sp. N3.4]TXK74692.1 transcriptional repressor [Paenibacillus sp. N3.4]